MLNSRRVPEFRCPYCDHRMNTIGTIYDVPADIVGHLFCCIECGEIGIFEADLQLRKTSPEEVEKLLADNLQAQHEMVIFRDFIFWRRIQRIRTGAMNN